MLRSAHHSLHVSNISGQSRLSHTWADQRVVHDFSALPSMERHLHRALNKDLTLHFTWALCWAMHLGQRNLASFVGLEQPRGIIPMAPPANNTCNRSAVAQASIRAKFFERPGCMNPLSYAQSKECLKSFYCALEGHCLFQVITTTSHLVGAGARATHICIVSQARSNAWAQLAHYYLPPSSPITSNSQTSAAI